MTLACQGEPPVAFRSFCYVHRLNISNLNPERKTAPKWERFWTKIGCKWKTPCLVSYSGSWLNGKAHFLEPMCQDEKRQKQILCLGLSLFSNVSHCICVYITVNMQMCQMNPKLLVLSSLNLGWSIYISSPIFFSVCSLWRMKVFSDLNMPVTFQDHIKLNSWRQHLFWELVPRIHPGQC